MSTLRSKGMVEIGLRKAEKYVAELKPWLSTSRLQDLQPFLPAGASPKLKARKVKKAVPAIRDDL